MIILIFAIAIFFAINMGASGFAVSFAPSAGSNIVKRKKALILFTIFVLVGAALVGIRVAKTLSGKIIPPQFITQDTILVILIAAAVSLFLANMLKIPQSTSIVTVGSLAGTGLYFRSLNLSMILYLIFVWIAVSLLSYFVTYFMAKGFYPLHQNNLRFHERLFRHHDKLAKWTLWTDCYSAFGVGTNNVANVVGPLIGAGVIAPSMGFFAFSLLFGLGGFLLGRGVLNTISKEIVPLGVVSASLVSLVVTSFIVGCSLLGLPAPYVQFSSLSILAIYTVKEGKGHMHTMAHPITKKILKVWVFTPLLSIFISYFLLFLLKIKV